MLKNYLKVAFRNLYNQKLYSFITIFGLAFGMACFLTMFSYLQFENSYDDFQKNGGDIYRVDKVYKFNGYLNRDSRTGTALASLLHENFPQVKNEVRFANLFLTMISSGEDAYVEKQFLFADSSFFSMFSFPLKIGNPNTVLANPFSVVLTPKTALKYFGNKNPIGQKVHLQMRGLPKKIGFTVTGITNDIPSNSTIKFDFLASFNSLNQILGKNFNNTKWGDGLFWTYIQLQNNYNPKSLEVLFPSLVKQYVPKGEFDIQTYQLIPLKDTYYNKGDGLPVGDWGLKPFSYLLLLMSLLVLIIACINYTNLLTAHSVTRSKEIGVRKVQGANRFQLIIQFVGESVLVSLIAFLISIVLVELLLPFFRSILSQAFSLGMLASREIDFNLTYPSMLGYMFLISIAVGILSGFYPALVLSRYNPSKVIKGELRAGKSSAWFRKILVVTQFAVSVIFIICSLHMLLQINYWRNSNLGFKKDNLICIPVYDNSLKEKYEIFKNKLLQNSGIAGVTESNQIPAGSDANILYIKAGNVKDIPVYTYYVDKDFIKTIGLKIVKGRDFSDDYSADTKSGIIVNQGAMKLCGFNNVGGQEIQLYANPNNRKDVRYTCNLIGEVKDFSYRFFKSQDDPLILKIEPRAMMYILIRINNQSPTAAIEYIRTSWKDMQFDQSFNYSYLTDNLESSFSFYDALDSFIRFASMVTIIIAVLGLFALASFVIDRKTKEIGIRKVMGASVKDIILKLTLSFIILVVIAEIIAVPVSYELISYILQGLPNHITFNIWIILSAVLFVTALAFSVVGLKAFKAAAANPVKSLRYE